MKNKTKKYTFRNYMEYVRDNPKGLWFKRKLYGWGWIAVKREGWIVVLSFLVIILANGLYFASKVTSRGEPSAFDLSLFFGTIIVSMILLFWICYKKGEKLKWTWGR